jgi:chemotaxis response regulator CheB
MCSSLTEEGSETLLQAMEAGAVDVILKPRIGAADHLAEQRLQIRDVVKAARGARSRPRPTCASRSRLPEKKLTADAMLPPPTGARHEPHHRDGRLPGRIDRRHRGAARGAGGAARQFAGHRRRPAHAARISPAPSPRGSTRCARSTSRKRSTAIRCCAVTC